jgi:hypothetical protein
MIGSLPAKVSDTVQDERDEHTHGAAPKALFLVSDLIAAKLLVITATKRLISQKFRTIMAIIKKKHETKNSASIIEYINGVHWEVKSCQYGEALGG